MDPDTGIVYDPHAESRMRQRRITRRQVEMALRNYHTSYPAETVRQTQQRTMIYVGTIEDRDLKVYIREGSSPVYVLTAAWKDE